MRYKFKVTEDGKEEMWIPTKEDIQYQDSMYTIIQNIQEMIMAGFII